MSVAEIFETMEYGPAPESASAADRWLEERGRKLKLYIGGQWVAPSGGTYFKSEDPSNGKLLAQVAQAKAPDVDAAVDAARDAFGTWSKLPGHARARYLYAIARHVQKNSRLLAVLEAMDNGKPIRETRDIDVPLVARHFYYHAGWAQLMESEFPGYNPVGVVGQIIPWNFPLLMLAWKIAPAIAMGNTVVLKPAKFTSVTAIAFAELLDEAGLPPGVVNVITGDASQVGDHLVTHPGIDKIAFTGSTDIGRRLRQQTAGSGKRLSLELGGKSPFIVFEDADLDSVVEGVVDAIWFNQGQVCCAGSRLLVQENIAERLENKLRERMEKLRVGNPLDKSVDMGAIAGPTQLKTIEGLVRQGVAEGSTMWQPSWSCPTDGCFFPPTLFTNVSPASTIAQVEIFGPVLVSMSFRTPAEAVALANNTRYGLAASVWSDNINLALDVARRLKAGTVWVNSTNVFDAASGFGGYRESGFGREGGKEGLYEYIKPPWESAEAAAPDNGAPHRNGNGHSANGASAIVTSDHGAEDGGSDGPKSHNGNGAEDIDSLPAHRPSTNPLFNLPAIDRTPKLYIKGKQARPDSGYSRPVRDAAGKVIGEVGEGNRKDIRNAVEAARGAESSWSEATGHNRAQILYYVAENLAARAGEFAARIASITGAADIEAEAEVDLSIRRLFTYAAWADKYDGLVHHTPLRAVTLAMPEPIGTLGLVAPDSYPLLGFISLVAPAIAMGNTVVVLPSEAHPLAATDFYQVLDTSDVPAGVVNIVTGPREELSKVLAEHNDIDGMWYFGTAEGSKTVELASVSNMKRTWVSYGHDRNWPDAAQGEGEEFLREATQVKNIWVPYGE